MEHLIDKDAVVAEIEKRKAINEKSYMQAFLNSSDNRDSFGHKVQEDIDILSSIDTLEVKEVDLEKVFNDEYSKFSNDTDAMDYAFPIDLADFKDFAKHFFELGIKAKDK